MELIIGSFRIRMDFGFPAMLSILLLCADGTLLLQTFAICIVHEAGHGIAMLLTRAGIREIGLSATGIRMHTSALFLSKPKELFVLLGGPCINFAAALCLYLLQGWGDSVMLHLAMGLFNLLPYAVLDGGSALQCILSDKPVLLRMQTVFCVLLSVFSIIVLLACKVPNPFLYLMCSYLAMAQLRVDKQGGMW